MTHSDLKLKVVLLLCLACAAQSTTPWEDWNWDAFLTNSSPPTPTLPTVSGISIGRAGFSGIRKTQYAYTLTSGIYSCQLICGPRSFLITSNGNLYCQRDSHYYGSLTNNGSAYQSTCLPNVEDINGCSFILSSINSNLQIGACDQANYQSQGPNYGKDCCYNDANTGTIHAVKTDETKIGNGNGTTDLRITE